MAKNGIGCAPIASIGLFLSFVIVAITGPHGNSANNDGQSDKAAAAQQAKQAAQEAAEQRAEDLVTAKQWGISIDAYEQAKDLEEQAYLDCVDAVKKAARFDVKSDTMPDYSWGADGAIIMIFGRDVHLQNGFGAYSAGYHCSWDIKSKTVVDIATD